MKTIKINREFIEQFDPCMDRWGNYLKHYSKWKGTLSQFMELDKISDSDKIWVFCREIKGIEKLQRKFAVYCMDRCQTDVQEVKDFQMLVILITSELNPWSLEESKDTAWDAAQNAAAQNAAAWGAAQITAYSAAAGSAYWAVGTAAYSAAQNAVWDAAWSAEQKVQVEIIKYLLEGGE